MLRLQSSQLDKVRSLTAHSTRTFSLSSINQYSNIPDSLSLQVSRTLNRISKGSKYHESLRKAVKAKDQEHKSKREIPSFLGGKKYSKKVDNVDSTETTESIKATNDATAKQEAPTELEIDSDSTESATISMTNQGRTRPSRSRSRAGSPYHIFIPSSHELQFNDTSIPKKDFIGTSRISPQVTKYTSLAHLNTKNEIPTLKHQLSRVLFSGPGANNVEYLKDPRTGVFNYTPYLSDLSITHPSQFDFSKVTPYVTSSKDQKLAGLSKHYGMKYFSSTSSMTSILSQLHFFISNFRPVDLTGFSKHDTNSNGNATRSAKLPGIVIVKSQGDSDIYSVDSDKSCDRETILSLVGNSLERFLTLSQEDFSQYLQQNKSADVRSLEGESSYHYAQVGNFLLRSQLDCYDDRLPGTGTFDLKTRAVSALRFDIGQAEEKEQFRYQLNKPYGAYESFESELIDLYKSTLLKYSLQARIGNMDGIFLAFHNVWQLFGFKYLPLSDIDEILHSVGTVETGPVDFNSLQENPGLASKFESKSEIAGKMAAMEFRSSIQILEKVLEMIKKNSKTPGQSFRLILNTEKINSYESKLHVISVPLSVKQIDEIQSLPQQLRTNITESQQPLSVTLNDHLSKVERINKQTFDQSETQGYSILIKHEINDRTCRLRHPSISKTSDRWESLIKIYKISPEETKAKYFKSLNQKMELLRENFSDDLQEASDSDFDELRTVLKIFARKGLKTFVDDSKKEKVWNQD
ncbi:hypothetical protein WICPIJ_000653 [Wickerhamomyces pijperi]|uniref:Uncharacterized protein n=1 Tax=Wickerhamomyces pijperi TaxID=599730 RepID=A0A9P8TRG8_WICPI|nr:hypothetical protein WICPIJ_000653 [Wickerhamomyces pijperi]